MNVVEMWKVVAAMVAVEFGLALVNILFKKALNAGTDRLIILVYRQSISAVFLIPFVYFWERSSWAKLTVGVTAQMFLCALLGLTLTQYLFLVGLHYTSATFTCAFINMVPVITFVLALPLGMEKVKMKSKSGKAKVFGTVTCAIGALILCLYKGIPVTNPGHVVENRQGAKGYGPGSAFLSAGSLAWSSWFLIQSRIGQNFPHRYSSTLIMSFFSAIQSAVLCFITDRNMSNWILQGELQILSVIYSGIVGSGLCYVVMSWCVKQRGPVFTSAFSPLIQFFAAVLDVLVLQEEIYLGSILGSVVVILGMYVLLWGKGKDEDTCDGVPKTTDGCNYQDSAQEVSRQ
ncbi:WAT1-related protein At3g30340 [Sesamum indicum]|uniref:WAT1-related protein n=1 Tax=Sesamum indicum TaxID=4182 RepID=A0A6I9U2S1_SESIN|nr:WAT1-related protein At3g30340 [Sesamum indicum]